MSVIALKPSPEEKKKSMRSGILLMVALCFAYYVFDYIKFTFFPDVALKTEVLSPTDINYTPFTSGFTLPMGKIKVHTRSSKGAHEVTEKTLKDFVGKPTIVHMWATWCPPCVQEMPVYNQYAAATKDKIQNLAIMSGQAPIEDIESFYKDKNIDQVKIMTDEQNSVLS
ncbi:MAG: TlpA disulfide reductase family protein, partial [Alphaproteobacteria bacterium]|nr:TlpA disulfide reductase family protein [Alphaproteobacteria bacterium]